LTSGSSSRLVTRYLVVVSEVDPVAPQVAERWGSLPATGERVDSVPLRRLGPQTLVLRRPDLHVHDERLDLRLPESLRAERPTLLFPSVHRSRENVVCLTVHPLGNLGPTSEVGGRPRRVNPTDPRSMTSVLRQLAEQGPAVGLPATFEATHHGPELDLPSFFVEIGYGAAPGPPPEGVRILARVISEIEPDASDRIAMGVSGGHYAPHFTDLALRRRWAFGHLISRHALEAIDAPTARQAYAAVPGAEGIVFARAQDADHPAFAGLAAPIRDGDAEPRARGGAMGRPSDADRPAGT
jgi:D-tyrosyl-tRNA(Tyr) deacylase